MGRQEMTPDVDVRPRHSRWTPSAPSTGTAAALFVHDDVYDAAMVRSYRWFLLSAWTHVTGKTTDCYVSNIGDEKLHQGEATCSQRCMIAGIGNEHASTYDVKMKGYEPAR